MSNDSSNLQKHSTGYDAVNYGPIKAVYFLLLTYFGSHIIAILPFLLNSDEGSMESALPRLAHSMLFAVVGFAIVHYVLKEQKNTVADIGFRNFSDMSAFGKALLGLVGYYLSIIFVLSLVGLVFPTLDLGQEQVTGFARPDGFVILFISLVIIPPILEELMMRGLLFSGLRKKLNFTWATIITSLIFGAAHLAGAENALHWPAAIDTLVLSFFLCYLREKTGSLFAPILLHMFKNFIALLYLIGVFT
jgi:membrane protease YdiL (CAAX protease family)